MCCMNASFRSGHRGPTSQPEPNTCAATPPHPAPQWPPLQINQSHIFKEQDQQFIKLAHKEKSALHAFWLPKLMAHTCARALTLGRRNKTLYKLAVVASTCKVVNNEKLIPVILLCHTQPSNAHCILSNSTQMRQIWLRYSDPKSGLHF